MYILDDGIRLNAALEMPENASGPMPLALIIHGFTGHMEEPHITAVAESLRQSGIATLRVDMYGHGKSEGTFRSHTLYKWLTNALTVIDYARGLDFVTDLYLIGHSQGGLTAMLAAGMKHDQIRALVALSPACMIPQAAREGTLLGQSFDPDHIPDTLPSWNNDILDGNYVRVAQTIHVEEAIDRFVNELPETDQIIFISRYWFLVPVAEIAKKCGCTQSKVKTTLFRLRKKLRDRLQEEGLC